MKNLVKTNLQSLKLIRSKSCCDYLISHTVGTNLFRDIDIGTREAITFWSCDIVALSRNIFANAQVDFQVT